jgi:hypothetical protein
VQSPCDEKEDLKEGKDSWYAKRKGKYGSRQGKG